MPKLYPFKFYNLSRTIKPLKEELWFESHQALLLRIVKTDEGRELLCLDKSFPEITGIAKNRITGKLPDGRYISEFRIGAKWANIIRFKWPQFVALAKKHYDDPVNLFTTIELDGRLLQAATTSTFYPDPHTETTTVDGRVGHNLAIGSGVTWSTLVTAAGNESADSETDHVPLHVVADDLAYNDKWRIIRRGIYLFDTSALGDSDIISSATLSLYGNNKATAGTPPSPEVALNIYSSNPASNTALTGTDYATLGTTAYCNTPITYTNWSTTGYNDFAFNASGLAAISKTSITKLGARDSTYDVPNSAPTWAGGAQAYMRNYFADQTGTSNDPKLVVVHTTPITVSPGSGDLTYTGFAPTISVSNNVTVTPSSGILTYTGQAPTVIASSITLSDFADGRIFQRNGTSAAIQVSGTYTGSPTAIQARVVLDGTSTEVVGWTTIVPNPVGGVYNGSLTVPQGGWYNLQVKFSNLSNAVGGTNKWGVGILVGCLGQSNMHGATTGWFSIGTDLTANTLLRKYTAAGWAALGTTGNGAIAFGNKLINALAIPVGLLNYGVDGSALRQEADSGYGYWLNTAAGSPYALFKIGFQSLNSEMEFIVWVQGEREAHSGVVTEAEYKTSIEAFITSQIRTDIINRSSSPNLPFIISTLGRSTIATDANWQAIKNALQWMEGGIADCYVGATATDLALIDVVHLTAASQTVVGQRMAQTVLDILGNETYHRGADIAYASQINNQTIDIILTHYGGTDFTPTTGITGFQVLDDGVAETITSAVRQSATSIRLGISGTITGVLSVRYLYGANPTITSPVYDNSVMTLPLEFEDDISVVGIQPDTGTLTYVGFAPSIPLASPGAGALTFTGFAPTVQIGSNVYPSAGLLTFTGFAPTVRVDTTLAGIYSLIETLPLLSEIEASSVLAKEATVASRLAAADFIAPDNAGIASTLAEAQSHPTLAEMLAGGVAKEATLATAQTDITSVLNYAIAMSKWKNNKMVRTGVIGTTETWVVYDDDNTTPLLTYTHNTSTKVRTKAT